jgi:hypothetical protein
MLFVPVMAHAGPWLVGPQPVTYTYPHVLGDGSNARGGEAPYFTNGEPDDIPSNFTVTDWLHNPPAGQYDGPGVGAEAKARFDCEPGFDGGHNDPIVNPGQEEQSAHDHTFIGNLGAEAMPGMATYASLRADGYTTCYGGPLNRSLYWEPGMYLTRNGIEVPVKPHNLITYYGSPGALDHAETAKTTRWGRGWNVIGGFNPADPNSDIQRNEIAGDPNNLNWVTNGFIGWHCNTTQIGKGPGAAHPEDPNGMEPYLADASGQGTLNCATTNIPGYGNGVLVRAEINAPWCWDGVNPTSPDGRSHMRYPVRDGRLPSSPGVCPDHWYQIAFFNVIVEFAFKSNAEMYSAHLSSDRMDPNPANWFRNGETMHFDFIPAWDYGTGDHPGVMVKFFQHCAGIDMHLKNSDGVTYTDLTGDPHECDFGRIDATESLFATDSPPAGYGGPDPIVNLSPDLTGTNRFYPLKTGTALPSAVIHTTQ